MHLKVVLQGDLGHFSSSTYSSAAEFRELQQMIGDAEIAIAGDLNGVGNQCWPGLEVILCNFWCRAPDISGETIKHYKSDKVLEASTLIDRADFLSRTNESRCNAMFFRALTLAANGFRKYDRSGDEIESIRDERFVGPGDNTDSFYRFERQVPKARKRAKSRPKTITLDHDDYAARYVGRMKDGRQFFLTTPFVPATGQEEGREFIALYVFDKEGKLHSATIDDFGPRATLDAKAVMARKDELLATLGDVRYQRVKVAPFCIERFGVKFGFIAEASAEPGDDWSVIVEPGNYMCFSPPWTSGEYDT